MNKRTTTSDKLPTQIKNVSLRAVRSGDSGDTERLRSSARSSAAKANAAARDLEVEVVKYRIGDRSINFNVDPTADTVWATKNQIADLFGQSPQAVQKHIDELLSEGELDDSVVRQARACVANGEGDIIEQYDLDVILAVGHRVKSPNARAFRKWAYSILRSYITKGFALNERRLRDDPIAADDLASRLRAIRAEEKHVFAKVRDYFKEASSDYDGSAKACRTFYALLQDKFHFAASGMTACQLILSRADHKIPNMGMTTYSGDKPSVEDAKVGKNYLSEEELQVLYIVSEQFLLHVMSRAIRNHIMTMVELIEKFDALLEINGYAVFVGYEREFQRPRADRHAMAEYARFMMRQKSKSLSPPTV